MGGIVIVGAGLAGLQAAEALRSGGWEGSITLLGSEPSPPYHRPPLSRAWLAGEVADGTLVMRAPEALANKRIELRCGVGAERINRERRTVHLSGGEVLGYTGLVIATGCRPRKLDVPGARAPNVRTLRSLADARLLREELQRCREAGRPVTIIGGGFIGLEIASTARKAGLGVDVLEAMPRLLARALSPQLADWALALHRARGVRVALGAIVQGFTTDAAGRVESVQCGDGSSLPTGLVVVGIGAQPEDALARAAGLECVSAGIVVDACSRTADPAIVAAGDCTVRRNTDGSLVRLESVNNANEQARSAAHALLGIERPFAGTPWFWSDQHECKIQMAGASTAADLAVARGDQGGKAFSLWHFREGSLVGVETVNQPREHLLSRKLLDAGVSPTPEQARDPAFDLSSLAPTPPRAP